MRFSKQEMQDLVWEDHDTNKFEIVDRCAIEVKRWTTLYRIVFSYGGEFFESFYELGNTEMQESEPYEYDGDENGMIKCTQVYPKKVTVTKYVTNKPE